MSKLTSANTAVRTRGGKTERRTSTFRNLISEAALDINAQDELGRSALHWAASLGDVKCAEVLTQDPTINLRIPVDTDGRTPLHDASIKGHMNVVDVLLKSEEIRCHVNAKDNRGRTALHWVAEYGRDDLVRLLVDRGADVSAGDEYGDTALHRAARGANIEEKDRGGQTPLYQAAWQGHEAIVRLLLDKGANIEEKDQNGRTPLLWAAERGHEAIVRLLLDKGANIEEKNDDGQTPLSVADNNGCEEIVRLLQSHRAVKDLELGVGVEEMENKEETGEETSA
ncbi:Serine/threonine-protein phosphatase 6 regulatory ankyrin repeat subunit A [Diplogelasinospora grovesii]|uniref:Serine/threonine-protein phosphatase 6 regulatory ankyrin repeat subunit A n=1 Tax=Diplogelasinospora grovesii TaxID=303347 RepID=A0AAN6N876_9PEZI|nr:Serine/threonine-protein phosphatase 6 regulatory ankyrin repeat subunit A [Diplogelasinospora grovesii]